MGVLINHLVAGVTEPVPVTLALLAIGAAMVWRGRRRTGIGFLAGAAAWLWFSSSGLMTALAGRSLEKMYPAQPVEEMPQADAIVLLGGGMGSDKDVSPYPEMWSSADRVWHAARLYKAGKAPIIVISGRQNGDSDPTRELLKDFGVPDDAMVNEAASGNTEENARNVIGLLGAGEAEATDGSAAAEGAPRKRVLLVTSAWHMRRALWNFRNAPFEVVPAPADYEATIMSAGMSWPSMLVPQSACAARNSYAWKEIIGYWGYRILGK